MKPSDITHILVHCSDSKWGNAAVIRKWHADPPPDGNGWSDIGYHYVICNQFPTYRLFKQNTPSDISDGLIEAGRPLSRKGAHEEKYNDRSIGICLIGQNQFTEAQFRSLRMAIHQLQERFHIPLQNVIGHYEVDENKTCPNFDMVAFRLTL